MRLIYLGACMMILLSESAYTLDGSPSLASVARMAYRAERMAERHEFADSLQVLESALSLDPTYVPLWRTKARSHIGLAQHSLANEALGVCLLYDQYNTDANYLSLINTVLNGNSSVTDSGKRASLLMDPKHASSLALFLQRRDTIELLNPLLDGWGRANTVMDSARSVLQLFAANRLGDARRVLHANGKDIPLALAAAIESLLIEAEKKAFGGLWKMERGSLSWSGTSFHLASSHEGQVFSWLRPPSNWRNVSASIDFSTGGDNPIDLYLRYSSPDSWIRLRFGSSILTIHERIPGQGVHDLGQIPKREWFQPVMRVVLKENRLLLYRGDNTSPEKTIPVSGQITEGSVALAGEAEHYFETQLNVDVTAIPDNWQQIPENFDFSTAREIISLDRTTAIIIPINDTPNEHLSRVLLEAAGKGVATIARMPSGYYNIESVLYPLRKLPSEVLDALWTGIIFEPRDAADLPCLEKAASAAKKKGLQTALLLSPDTATKFAVTGQAPRTDWLLCNKPEDWSGRILGGLGMEYARVLYGTAEDGQVFRQ